MKASNNLIKNEIHNLFIEYEETREKEIELQTELSHIRIKQLKLIVKIENLIGDFDKNE